MIIDNLRSSTSLDLTGTTREPRPTNCTDVAVLKSLDRSACFICRLDLAFDLLVGEHVLWENGFELVEHLVVLQILVVQNSQFLSVGLLVESVQSYLHLFLQLLHCRESGLRGLLQALVLVDVEEKTELRVVVQ